MAARAIHRERHRSGRTGWLRASVLGANDGIVSTASLLLGVAATEATTQTLAVTGLAGLVAGATSMAAGEYVSVSTQRDTERADIDREKGELATQPEYELDELTQIYVHRGLDLALANTVARRMMEVDPLGSHLRDELGLTEQLRANPLQAALASALAFAAGAALPMAALALSPPSLRQTVIAGSALFFLAGLGALGGKLGEARPLRAALRVAVGGALAMAATSLIGKLVGISGL
jgi:vacuolar iron transporter family protein